MTKQIKEVKPPVPEEEIVKLTGTFFDTFSFPDKTEEEIAAEKKTADDKEAADALAEKNKGKTEEEIKAEEEAEAKRIEEEEAAKKTKPVEPTAEEIEAEKVKVQEELQTAVDTLKEKDEKDLDDEEKQFLKDFEAGDLKDYIPPKKTEDEPEATGYDTLTKDLVAEGILAEPEEIADTVESFNSAITLTVENKFNDWVEEIPEEYRNILDHLRAGGNANTYLQSKQEIDYANLDFTNEGVQTALVRADLQQQGHTEDEVAEKLTDLKDLEKMEKESKRAAKKFEVEQTQRIKEYDQSIIDAAAVQDKKEQDEIDELSTAIDEMKDVAGFKLTDKRRKAFKNFLFEVDDAGETAASKASTSVEDKIKLYFMSFINYDFSDLQKSVTTQKTRDLSKFLTRFKDTQTASKGTVVKDVPPEPETTKLHIPSIFDRPNVED